MAKYKTIIGRYEFLELRELLSKDVPVKIDTGAYYSAINAKDINIVKKDGVDILSCIILAGHPSYPYERKFETGKFEKRSIENSFGHSEYRYVVNLKIKLANKVLVSQFTLADRSTKTFPILIGRKLLNNRFLVDTSLCHIPKQFMTKYTPKALNDEGGHVS